MAVTAHFDHVDALRQLNGAAVCTFQTPLPLQRTQIFADTVLGDLKLCTELFDLDLSVTFHHTDDELLAFL